MNIVQKSEPNFYEGHDNGISTILSNLEEMPEKVVLFDLDSAIYHTTYSGKDEFGNRNPEFNINDLPYLEGKLNELILKHINQVEQYFKIKALYMFIKGRNNFRKEIYPEYKAHRTTESDLIKPLLQYVVNTFNAIESHGAEADDYIYTFAQKLNWDCIVLTCDKDLFQMPTTFYNYLKDKWSKVDEKEAMYNTYKLLCCGDAADGINFTKGLGIRYFEKNFSIDFTQEQYEEALLNGFLKVYKGDCEKAEEMINLSKQLILLKDVQELLIKEL